MFATQFHRATRFLHTVSSFSSLINRCFSLTNPSPNSLKLIQARLIKLGLNSNIFLGNRCIDLCLNSGSASDALKIFQDMPTKNIFSWNLYLKVFVKCHDIETARQVFDEMPERDSVSWNTIVSGYISYGFLDSAWEMFLEMRNHPVKPSEFTFSMLLCCVKCEEHAKEMHGYVMRHFGCRSNLVVQNSLVDVYGKLGLMDYALAVFLSMEKVDVVSWNSIISGFCKSGHENLALQQFWMMGISGFKVDEYTVSSVLTACSSSRSLEKGKQIFSLCIKLGFLWNTLVSSAAIDLFSKCNRMESAVRLFKESNVIDSAICNSMIACYVAHGLLEDAFKLFVDTLRENIKPTEFTLSCVIHSAANFVPAEQGSQIHSLVIKTGFESDVIVISSLVTMYGKYGLIDFASKLFDKLLFRDLIAWNSMILALTYNGKLVEALCLFKELLQSGLCPDQKTFSGVLLACSYGGFLEEAVNIYTSMEKQRGVKPINDHYALLVEMMVRAGKIGESIDLLQAVKCNPHAFVWETSLFACGDYGDLRLIERVAERLMELEPHSTLPYLILSNAYERSGKWESLVRVRKDMNKMASKEIVDCSWIGIKGRVLSFEANAFPHHGGKNVYSVLGLLMVETWDEYGTCFN